ncbi:helix-turn-helix domain-containing protein [Microbulbifer sp. ZKSA002]|uniref:helix-turn-helix domain-containing protein n=1 Tax=Microbulbifer sp. ZKSA002 TaxID=3243388 RepID=UPI0040399E16
MEGPKRILVSRYGGCFSGSLIRGLYLTSSGVTNNIFKYNLAALGIQTVPAPVTIALTDEERKEFQRLCRSGKTPAGIKERLSIVLLGDEDLSNREITERLPFSAHKIARWRNRFAESGFKGNEKDLPRGSNHGGQTPYKPYDCGTCVAGIWI